MHHSHICGGYGHTCGHKNHGKCLECGHICHKEHVCSQFGERQICPQFQGDYTCQQKGEYICPQYLESNITQNTQNPYEKTGQIDPAAAKRT